MSILTASSLFAIPLTEQDYKQLEKQRQVERILYETYLATDKGLASVFGYHFDTYFHRNWSFTLAIFGAVGGERGGYGIAAYGLGYTHPVTPRLSLDWRFITGSGGGGGLDAGGGLLIESHIGATYQLNDTFSLDLRYGYLKFLTGTFETPVIHMCVSLSKNGLFLRY